MAAPVIIDKIEVTVKTYLNLEPMKRVISSNALESFNLIYDSKAPEIIQQVEDTAKEIWIEEPWLKTHVELIALATVEFEKENLQELVNTIIHSSTAENIIVNLAKAACNGHAAKEITVPRDSIHTQLSLIERKLNPIRNMNHEQEQHK